MFPKVVLSCVVIFQSGCSCSSLSSILESGSFTEVRQSPYFIDKTLLLLKAINNEEPIALTAPPGFGKSTNLDMIRIFLSNTGDNKVSQEMFADTKISKDSNFVKTHLGNYPVIHCSFEPMSPVTDYNTMLASFRLSLQNAFLQHQYLMKSTQLAKGDLDRYKKFIDAVGYINLESSELSSGLGFLSKILQNHHNKPVILLIDGYDSVILDSVMTKSLGIREVLGFYDSVLNKAVFNNNNIKKTILTGTSCTLLKLLPGLDKVNCVKFLQDKEFEPFYGLTGGEVDYLVGKTVYSKLRPNLTQWYDGYTSPDLSAQIYNTKSLLSFLLVSQGELQSYWKNLKVQKALRILLEDSVRKPLLLDTPEKLIFVVRELKEISEGILEGVKNMICQEIWDADVSDLYIHLLMEQGFFTFEAPWHRSGYNSSVTFKVPNLDVCRSLQQFIKDFIEEMKKQSSNLNIM